MKSFNERNPVTIAIVGLVLAVLAGLGAFYWKSLPFVNSTTDYHADFSEAAGLKSGDDVRVAGVKVGTVSDVVLERGHVRVDFGVDDTWVGDKSEAAIEIKTLLGQKYLGITPIGTRPLDPDEAIPLGRTTSPVDVTQALNGLGRTFGRLKPVQLAKSFTTLADAFRDTPTAVRGSLRGLSALSATIASRDQALARLLANARRVTAVLAEDNPQIQSLLRDGNLLLRELRARSAAITALLRGTEELGRQLSGLVDDNNATLHPALAQLERVTTILQDNQASLQNALRLIGPYYTLLDDAVGTGPWLDTYICGLFNAANAPQLDSTATRDCAPQAGG